MSQAEQPVVEVVTDLVPPKPCPETQHRLASAAARYVRNLIRDVVGREPSPIELEGWLEALRGGQSRRALASAALHSDAFRRNEIIRIYSTYLGRVPSQEGIDFWTGALASGKTWEEILATILSSPEFSRSRGGNHDGFVRAIFQECLLRRASDAEASCWVGLLDSFSGTRLTIALGLLSGEEYQLLKLGEWFRRFLKRQPDRDETEYWLFQMKHGHSMERVQIELLSGQEYFYRAQYVPALPSGSPR